MNLSLKVLGGVLLAVILWLLFIMIPTRSKNNSNLVPANDTVYDSLQNVISRLSCDKDKLADSLFGKEVEKGYLQVELNKSRSEVDRYISQHTENKIKRDTVKIVQNCDSLVNELNTTFIPTTDVIYSVDTSIQNLVHTAFIKTDSLLRFESEFRRKMGTELTWYKEDSKTFRANFNKAKKQKPWFAAGGFVLGILATIFITK